MIFSDPILQPALEIGSPSNPALLCICEAILFLAGNPTTTNIGLGSPLLPNSNDQLILFSHHF